MESGQCKEGPSRYMALSEKRQEDAPKRPGLGNRRLRGSRRPEALESIRSSDVFKEIGNFDDISATSAPFGGADEFVTSEAPCGFSKVAPPI
jgi:hypothetical protein